MMAAADYPKYLASIYPGTQWVASKLTGGIVNFTFRMTLLSGTAPHQSLVLKHARPYIAAGGPEWEFSTDRQVIEAELLRLWDESGALYSQRDCATPWRSPKLISHERGKECDMGLSDSEQEASILLLADLGELINIVDFLKLRTTAETGVPIDAELRGVAEISGRALAIIHHPSTTAIIQSLPTSKLILTHNLTQRVELKTGVSPIESYLAGHQNAGQLFSRVFKEFEHALDDTYPKCLAFGDFSPGSILVERPTLQSDTTPILVDWEFGRVNGRGVNGDMAGFLASIRCEMMVAQAERCEVLYLSLLRFTEFFCEAYRLTADLTYHKRIDDVNLKLLRSAFILHGREMISRAHDTYHEASCWADMVELGAWYIERAGDSLEQFLSDENWTKIGEEPNLLLQSLFRYLDH